MENLTANERYELRVLELVEERSKVTQRGVAAELEIAIGMANSLVKRLIQKGYIKVKDAPSRRYGYYLTPEGFLEKSRLVSKYIANSFKFFGEVRRDYETIASNLAANHCKFICCVGTGEVMEIAQMVFHARNLKTLCVLDVLAQKDQEHFTRFSELPDEISSQVDFLVMTETSRPHKAYEIVASSNCGKNILVPAFMKIKNHNFQIKNVEGL